MCPGPISCHTKVSEATDLNREVTDLKSGLTFRQLFLRCPLPASLPVSRAAFLFRRTVGTYCAPGFHLNVRTRPGGGAGGGVISSG